MFQSLRQGSPLYVFFKSDPKAVIGEVVRIDNQIDQFGNKVFVNGLLQQKVAFLDIVATLDGEERTFSHVGADYSITDSGLDGIILSDNRQEFIEAINAYSRLSEKVLADIDKHKNIVAKCATIVAEFDPQKRIEREQSEEIERLKQSMSNVQVDLSDIKAMLSKALGRGSKIKEDS